MTILKEEWCVPLFNLYLIEVDMKNLEELHQEFQKIIEEDGILIHEVSWVNTPNGRTLEVAVMFEDGSMDIDTCQMASEKFSLYLDQDDVFDFEYILDVCSPGAERELRTKEEIKAEIGEYVYVKFKNPLEGKHELKGYLEAYDEGVLTILYMDKTREKSFELDEENLGLIRLAVKV